MEFFQAGYYNTQSTPEKRYSDSKSGAGDHFAVEDLLEFPNDEVADGNFDGVVAGISADSSAVTVVDSCNSSLSCGEPHFPAEMGCRSFVGDQFSGDLCVPYDDLAELEWLSNFVEESFSSEDLQKLQLISGRTSRGDEGSETRGSDPDSVCNNPVFRPEVSVPGKARSKRSRTAPGNWASRLLALSPTLTIPPPSSEHRDVALSSGKKTVKVAPKKRDGGENSGAGSGGDGRKCLHCATDKTPQWRTGPMGPKTLCNACGVRYKSGRLVPEYRPAASPTFMLTKHSNSHRKVMELRRQKELQRTHPQHQFFHHDMTFDGSNGDDYLIHQHIGPDFGQLI
ncbi:GATA transcription factor [Actinidia chinensis var. chinensis]|uniref:GATA transcription factor n=1 Tax=Actinidia chinensis var. chinensis TaxID=1590841 RepID=A0A2R6PIS3_ACTCC|nr:GATA transcription factor [Actinidia chinensis var. chinensis]